MRISNFSMSRAPIPNRWQHGYFQIANDLPEPLCGVGLFQPSAQYRGVGWICAAGLGRPHVETLASGAQQNDSGYD
jgi:hypothetical protein